MPNLAQWQVYHVANCRFSIPPKNKFVVVAYLAPDLSYCFFVNSKINQFIVARKLTICESPILAAEHAFLNYDSWVDCTSIYAFATDELFDYKTTLSVNAQIELRKSVQGCRVLKNHHKLEILGHIS